MSYTSHAEQTIQVMATRDLIQNSILEQNELKLTPYCCSNFTRSRQQHSIGFHIHSDYTP